MTRKPDDVKKGLEEELPVHYHIDGEPRLTPRQYMELQWLHKDALDLIQQLQDENAQQARCIENMTDKLNAMNDEVAKLQAERDAAVACIPRACAYCKWYGTKHGGFFPDCKNPNGCRNVRGINTGWEWRGIQKEDGNEKTC